jgi:pimeloyl-ACP methyl ester carboxylesterase
MKPDDTAVDPEHPSGPVADWVGLGDLVELATERISMPVEGIHRAITLRWVDVLTPAGSKVGSVTESAIGAVYGTVRSAGALVGGALGLVARQAAKHAALRPLWGTGRGGTARAMANAVWGDELERRGSTLSLGMGLRTPQGDPVSTAAAPLAQTYHNAYSRLAVLIHGWSETEQIWHKLPDDGRTASLATSLESERRTVLLVRYNSGRHVSANGADLASLLDAVAESWPVDVEQIDLVGHSMGGLVARSAVVAGAAAAHRWTSSVGHLVTLGTPHLGSPIEKGLAAISQALRIAPESEPLGQFLDLRSHGVKDMRFGAITNHDWLDACPDRLIDVMKDDAVAPDGITRHFATGVVTQDPAHPLGRILGDLVVRSPSGTGRGTHREVAATDVRVFGGRRHRDLLRDVEVHAQVRDWLS